MVQLFCTVDQLSIVFVLLIYSGFFINCHFILIQYLLLFSI